MYKNGSTLPIISLRYSTGRQTQDLARGDWPPAGITTWCRAPRSADASAGEPVIGAAYHLLAGVLMLPLSPDPKVACSLPSALWPVDRLELCEATAMPFAQLRSAADGRGRREDLKHAEKIDTETLVCFSEMRGGW